MKKHILLIADDKDRLTLFISAFSQLNIPYKCTWAKSGEQALKQLVYLTPDLIIINVVLPWMDGFQCLDTIRQYPHLTTCPVILLSPSHVR